MSILGAVVRVRPEHLASAASRLALLPGVDIALNPGDGRLVLDPLSAFRAMSKAAEIVYGALRQEGTQKGVLDRMQTRVELYEVLGYHDYEQKLDQLFVREGTVK